MKLFSVLAAVVALSGSVILASPILDEKRDLVCLVHTVLIHLLTLNHGEAFCSAYLHIQTLTILTTTTKKVTTTKVSPAETITITTVTGTQTETLTSLATSLTTAISTVETTATLTETDTITVTSTTTLTPARKRAPEAHLNARIIPAIPAYLSAFPTPQISAACSCLRLPTPRTTSTATTSQTSTVVSTPPPVTSQVATFTIITVTITNTNTITEVQTLTNTIPTTITETSTTTAIVTESPVVLGGCANPAVRRPYSPNFIRTYEMGASDDELTLSDCCNYCWTLANCFSFRWEGTWNGDITELSSCYVFTSYYSADIPIEGPTPAICPRGVEQEEQLNLNADPTDPNVLWGIGPCDRAGVEYA